MRIDADLLARLPDDLELHVTVTVAELREMIAADAPASIPQGRDLSLEEFAEAIGRAVSTARGLCASGKVAGAYKQNGRDWWIPAASLRAYQEAQAAGRKQTRAAEREVRLDGWRDDVGARRPTRRRRVG